MELVIMSELDQKIPLVNISNFEELKHELTEQMERYNNLIVTEDTIKDAKAFRANLNKLKEALETRRKEIKNQCMEPYYHVEPQFKELTGLVDAPIAAIDSQLKSYDEQRKAEKLDQIEKLYDSIFPENIKQFVSMARIYDKRWQNVSTNLKTIEEEMRMIVQRITVDLQAIDKVNRDFYTAVRLEYTKTLDLGAAWALYDALQTAAAAQQEAIPSENPPAEQKPAESPQTAPSAGEKMYRLCLELQLTMAQANALKKFLADNNITYTKI